MRLRVDISAASSEQSAEISNIEELCIPGGWSEKSLVCAMKQENSIFLAAMCENRTAGFINGTFIADEAEIMNVAVLPEYRRNGFAERLVGKFCAIAYEKGAERVFLEVREMNLPASELYRKLGFTVCGKRNGYYRNPCDNALVMMRNLKDGDFR